ncbi:MAG: polymer-forming cytoskeletal protein [Planctomycetota bacterium]
MSSSTQVTAVLAHGARIEGDLHLEHDAVIHGTVTGSVHSQAHVEIAAEAVVGGDVYAVSLTLAGQIAGRAEVAETTRLLASGQLQGPLETAHLTAEEGATFDGQLRMCQSSAVRSENAVDTTATKSIPPRRQRQVDLSNITPDSSVNPTFKPIPGSVNAGIRSRRRVSQAS